MEKFRRKNSKSGAIMERMGRWISNSPKFEKMIELARYYFKNPEKLNEAISEAYNKATNESGKKNLGDMWSKIMTLVRMLKASMNSEYKYLSKAKIIIGTAVLLYFALPSDVLPDFLPFIGFADDMGLLAWFIKNAADEIAHFEQWENQRVPVLS